MSGPNTNSDLDQQQIIQRAFEDANDALRIKNIGGALVLDLYDFISISYVPSGNGAGQIATVVYKSGGSSGTTVATLTLAYNSDNKLTSVTKA